MSDVSEKDFAKQPFFTKSRIYSGLLGSFSLHLALVSLLPRMDRQTPSHNRVVRPKYQPISISLETSRPILRPRAPEQKPKPKPKPEPKPKKRIKKGKIPRLSRSQPGRGKGASKSNLPTPSPNSSLSPGAQPANPTIPLSFNSLMPKQFSGEKTLNKPIPHNPHELAQQKQFLVIPHPGITQQRYLEKRSLLFLDKTHCVPGESYCRETNTLNLDVQKVQTWINETYETNLILNPVEFLFWFLDDVKNNDHARKTHKKEALQRLMSRLLKMTPYCNQQNTPLNFATFQGAQQFYRQIELAGQSNKVSRLPVTATYQSQILRLCGDTNERILFRNIWSFHNNKLSDRQLKARVKKWRRQVQTKVPNRP